MQMIKKNWHSEEGSIDFIQLVVGLMIISIAAVGTLQALYYGYDQLDFQMRHRKAISIARSYVEYLQGRLHADFNETDFNDVALKAGNLANPHIKLLDDRDPSTDLDDVVCEVSHRPLVPIDQPETKGMDYWVIQVFVRWYEPNSGNNAKKHSVFFDARMVPSGI
jgi:hypothetical protein